MRIVGTGSNVHRRKPNYTTKTHLPAKFAPLDVSTMGVAAVSGHVGAFTSGAAAPFKNHAVAVGVGVIVADRVAVILAVLDGVDVCEGVCVCVPVLLAVDELDAVLEGDAVRLAKELVGDAVMLALGVLLGVGVILGVMLGVGV